MSVESQLSKITYLITEGVLTYSFPYKFFSKEDIEVWHASADGETQEQFTLDEDYTISPVQDDYPDGANVVLSEELPAGDTLIIRRVLDVVQQTSLPASGKLNTESLESQLDKIVMICQQLTETVGRALVLPITFTEEISSVEELIALVYQAAADAEDAATAADDAKDAAEAAQAAAEAARDEALAATMRWRNVSAFTRVSDSTFTVTDNEENQKIFTRGTPLKYKATAGSFVFGYVTNYSAGTVTIAGAPLDTDHDDVMEYDACLKAFQFHILISGLFAASTGDKLNSIMKTQFPWTTGNAKILFFSASQKTVDSTTQPKVNLKIAGNLLSTNDSNNGIQLSTSNTIVKNPATAVNTSNYSIAADNLIEVNVSAAGGTGDCADLSLNVTAIYE